jgi:hypothetical protein
MIGKLEEAGIERTYLRWLGWFNGGVNNRNPETISAVRALGDMNAMRSLDDRLAESGGALYPDVSFQTISFTSGIRQRFNAAKDAARTMEGYAALRTDADRVSRSTRNTPYMEAAYTFVSPNTLHESVGGFMSGYQRYNLRAAAVRDIGSSLVSDKNRRYPVSRGEARTAVQEQLDKLSASYSLMISGGNEYALPYAKAIADAPATADHYGVVDDAVPFYEMVLHGYIDLAAPPVNLLGAHDARGEILHLIEYGLSPHYIMSWQPSDILEYTAYTKLYQTGYVVWLDEAAEVYAAVSGAVSGLRDQPIARHIIHAPGVRETVYANGVSTIVNYTDSGADARGMTIPARGYIVTGGGIK